MKAHIITIGNELLIGQVIDTNSAWLGEQLTGMGVEVEKIISIQDEENEIIHQLEKSCTEAKIIIVSGGLGPTKDDITKSSIAKFLGVKMLFNQDAYDGILRYLQKHNRKAVDSIKHHAFFPENTIFLKNDLGTAPGMVFRKDDSIIISVPGVPYELKFIMENEGLNLVRSLNKSSHIIQRTILTAGEFEARLADRLNDIVEELPDYFSIAFLPNLNQVRLRLTATGSNHESLEVEMEHFVNRILDRLEHQVFGFEKDTLSKVVGKQLLKNKLVLSTAESCTGGYLSHIITSEAGSSEYYIGSIIAYSNKIKHKHLEVKNETLDKFGAVSEETVLEMVDGALKVTGSNIAVSVSGIAGPGGGSEEKPVGTIWLACGNHSKKVSKKIKLGKDRLKNIQSSAIHALDLLRIFLMDNYPD